MACSSCRKRRQMLADAGNDFKAGNVVSGIRTLSSTVKHTIKHPPKIGTFRFGKKR